MAASVLKSGQRPGISLWALKNIFTRLTHFCGRSSKSVISITPIISEEHALVPCTRVFATVRSTYASPATRVGRGHPGSGPETKVAHAFHTVALLHKKGRLQPTITSR
jgi:hypothetical protein